MTTKKAYEVLKVLVGGKDQDQFMTPLILGKPGIGKSYIVRKLKEEMGYKHLIDLRLSQHEESDFKIPDKKDGVVTWLTSDFIPTEDNPNLKEPGILFLDEINRASQQVMQAVFQIVLDRMIGTKKIRSDWKIIAAGNLGYKDKTFVNEMDSALKNRFAFINVDKVDRDEFLDEEKTLHHSVRSFLLKNPSKLYIDDQEYLVTPRSWTKLSQYLNQYKGNDFAEYALLIAPSIVHSAAGMFYSYLREYMKVSPEDVLNRLPEVEEVLAKYERGDIHALNTELCAYLSERSKFTKEQIANFNKYFQTFLLEDNRMYVLKILMNNNKNFLKKWVEQFPEHNEVGSSVNTLIKKIL